MTKNSLPAVALLLDGARGVYIPRDFVQGFDLSKWENIRSEDIETLQNPDNEWYWEAWQNVLDNATFTENGNVWRLWQDGDLWAMCYELMSNEERRNFDMEEVIPTYYYFINLDERGEFSADVRDESGNTVFEIQDFEIFEDGFMSDKNDIEGLTDYLREINIIESDAVIEKGN